MHGRCKHGHVGDDGCDICEAHGPEGIDGCERCKWLGDMCDNYSRWLEEERERRAEACRTIADLRTDLAEARRDLDALREALTKTIDLAEFWINREDTRKMSSEEYRIWLALGHRSNWLQAAKAAIDAARKAAS
jgi:hypothetical protein